MQNLSKRQWSPNLSLKDAIDLSIDLSIRCRQKNVFASDPAKLYYGFVVADSPDLSYFHSMSQLYKFSQKDTPYNDYARDKVLRMLSVAVKCHFFLFPQEKIAHEPYFFAIPDLSAPSKTFFGLVYKLSSQDKAIIVCERDLRKLPIFKFEKIEQPAPKSAIVKAEPVLNILYEFPTVVPEDNFKWFHYKKWYKLKEEHNLAFGNKEKNQPSLSNKNTIFNELKTLANVDALDKKASIINVPYDLKDQMMECGCMWHPTLKVWYLPKGYDYDCVSQYLNHLKTLIK